jgi:hypothetical protein
MKKYTATIIGFLIAPLVAAVAWSSLGAVSQELNLKAIPAWTLIFYFYILCATFIVGLPAYLLMKRFDKVTWWSATLTGIISGAVMKLIFTMSLSVIVIGGLNGFVFWVIWRWGTTPKQT